MMSVLPASLQEGPAARRFGLGELGVDTAGICGSGVVSGVDFPVIAAYLDACDSGAAL